jgi:hypothetical protein
MNGGRISQRSTHLGNMEILELESVDRRLENVMFGEKALKGSISTVV